MALTKAQKTEQLNELKEKMKDAKSIMFAHYIGMTVSDVSDFRKQLRDKQSEMKVAKKTLMQIAAKDMNLPEISDDLMDGAVACIFSYDDPLTGAQIAFKFGKEHPQVELIGGVFEGKIMNKEETIRLAKIPGKTQLLGMFMAMCNGPLSSFARGLSELAKQKDVIASPSSDAPAAEAPKAEAAPAAETPKAEEAAPVAAEAAPTPATTEEAPAAPAADAPPAA